MSGDANANAGVTGGTSAIAADSDEAATVSVDSPDETYASDQQTVKTLSGVEFAVEDDEFVCTIGPSGCGKTTLFRIIADLEDATSDAATLDSSPVTDPGTDRGMVFQEYGLFPRRTVGENVVFGLEEQGVGEPTRSERVTGMLRLAGLDDFTDAYPKELSGGVKQHVGIARAPAVGPELFLIDEPFGVVDAQTRDMLHGKLLDIWAETGKTVLFVTHDVEEAATLADRMVVMAASPGRIREIVSINTDRPRERTEGEFAAYVKRIHRLIGE